MGRGGNEHACADWDAFFAPGYTTLLACPRLILQRNMEFAYDFLLRRPAEEEPFVLPPRSAALQFCLSQPIELYRASCTFMYVLGCVGELNVTLIDFSPGVCTQVRTYVVCTWKILLVMFYKLFGESWRKTQALTKAEYARLVKWSERW
jgi:hypothetical protein